MGLHNRFLIRVSICLLFFSVNVLSQQVPQDFGAAGDYNLFVLKNAFLTSSDIQGRAAVGGNALFEVGYSIGDQLENSGGSVDVLTVGESVTYLSGRVYHGNLVYRDTANVHPNLILNGEGNVIQGYPIDFIDAALTLSDISRQWKTIPDNGNVTSQDGGLILSGSDPALNVFYVFGDQLNDANNFTVDCPIGSTVLINIDGELINWSGGFNVQGTNQTNLVVNFFEADTIHLSGIEINGSILAPFSHLNFISGAVNGNVLVYSVEGAGQFNHSWFQGEVIFENSEVTSDCEVTIKKTLTGTSYKLNPSFGGHNNLWAGTFLGYVNDHSTEFYCVDILHFLDFNKPYSFDQVISGPIYYVVNNYYPMVEHTGTGGQLNRSDEEAAAVQTAIWYFSDGLDPNWISNNNRIRDRALAIIESANNQNPSPVVTFSISPASLVRQNGASANFTITAKDHNGEAVENAFIQLSTTSGSLNIEEGFTNNEGKFSFTLFHDGESSNAHITAATFEAILPPASRYHRPNKQTIITNKPVITCLETSANMYWIEEPIPGSSLDFYVYDITNSDIPENYITDVAAAEI